MPFKDLPKPDGNYIIGTDIFILEDLKRTEFFTDNPSDNRKIIVQAWYPAINVSDSIYPYLDFADIRIPYIAKRVGVSERMIKHIKDIKANAYYKALPINKEFPVIIFSHGLGGNRTQNAINAESLASNGYIVFAIEHTYDANITVFNDSTYYEFNSYLEDTVSIEKFYQIRLPQINTRAKDILFLIDQITIFKTEGFYIGRMSNLDKIGIFGHSFGGGTAVVSSYIDSRIDACLSLDGWFEPVPINIINNGIDIPFCYIGQIQKNWDGAPFNEVQLLKFHNNNSNSSDIIEIRKTKHFDYADIPYLNKSSRLLGLSGKAGKKITMDLNKTINGFFDMHLKNNKKDWIKSLKNNYNISHNMRLK